MPGVRDRRADEAQAQMAAIVESSADAIAGQALDGTITTWNPGAERLVGYTADEILGRPGSLLVPPERADEPSAIRERVSRGERIEQYETVWVRRDGRRIDVSLSISPIREGGRYVGVAIIARDVTERNRVERENVRLLLRQQEAGAEARAAEGARREAEAVRERAELVERLLTAREEERRRVALEVHDDVAQLAIGVHQHLQAFARHHRPRRPDTRRELARVVDLSQAAVRASRRVIANLRPSTLDDFGLTAALEMEVEALRADGWDVSYAEALGAERLPTTVETALFRVAQEALANVRRHAGPTHVRVDLRRTPRGVRLEVADQGRGFDPAAVVAAAGPGERVGLTGMRERAALLRGRCDIRSRPGGGTSVRVTLPPTALSTEPSS